MKSIDIVRNAYKAQESISFPADTRKRQGINQSLLNALLCTKKYSLENFGCQGAIIEKMAKGAFTEINYILLDIVLRCASDEGCHCENSLHYFSSFN